jgi:hypothetical protein
VRNNHIASGLGVRPHSTRFGRWAESGSTS